MNLNRPSTPSDPQRIALTHPERSNGHCFFVSQSKHSIWNVEAGGGHPGPYVIGAPCSSPIFKLKNHFSGLPLGACEVPRGR
jgi:hypothetical protein